MTERNKTKAFTDEARAGTGISGLDSILQGGLPREHLYLIEGEPGSGKTTIALQFLMEGRRAGEPVLYITLSESIRELTVVARSHGWSLDGIDLFEVIPSPEALLPEDQYTVFHPVDVELGTTLKGILEQVEAIRPSRVVFDSLSEIRLLVRDSTRYHRQILGLKQFLASRHCTALLLDDSPAPQPTDTTVLSIVHGVLRMERMPREYGAKRRRLEVVKLRGALFHDGYHDYDIKTGGVTVYPRLTIADHYPSELCLGSASGLPELDQLLGGGLDRGTSTLLVGPAGAGKSGIAMQYAAAAATRGELATVFLFDEGLTTLFRRAGGLGLDLERLAKDGALELRQLDPAELCPGAFVHQIRTAVLQRNLRFLVIDTLNGFLNAMPGEHSLTAQLHELLSFLNQHGVVTILVLAQYGILGSVVESPVDVSYLADTVILLRFFEAGGKVRKAISVAKKRSGAHEHTIRELKIGPDRIRIGAPLTAFRGILSGLPYYVGQENELMNTSDAENLD